MARILTPLSISFTKELISQIDERALSLSLSRSGYLRQLVVEDLQKAGDSRPRGKQTLHERVRELETEANLRRQEIEAIKKFLAMEREVVVTKPAVPKTTIQKKKTTKRTKMRGASTPSPDESDGSNLMINDRRADAPVVDEP